MSETAGQTDDDMAVGGTVTSESGAWAMVPAWVLGAGLTPGEFLVYVSLRSFADRQGDAFPRVRTIAERAGVSMSLAERAISKMRTLGLLTSTQLYRNDGSVRGCDYHLRDVPPGPESSRGLPRSLEDSAHADPQVSDIPAGQRHPTHVGNRPNPRGEQEHTIEHTKNEGQVLGSRHGPITAPRRRHDDDQIAQKQEHTKNEGQVLGSRHGPITAPRRRHDDDSLLRATLFREFGDLDDAQIAQTRHCLGECHRAVHPGAWLAEMAEQGTLTGFIGNHGLGSTCAQDHEETA